jgi:hypothetical protein
MATSNNAETNAARVIATRSENVMNLHQPKKLPRK